MSHTSEKTPLPVPPYVGNGPYCYTNSLLTVLGGEAPTPGIVETLTSSAFGFQLLAGRLPLFDPYGWNPDHGLDQALRLLGYSWRRVTSDSATQALTALRDRVREGPVLIGPVDMGLLAHQPGSDRATGADHFVVALDVTPSDVVFHDPQGHPWARLPHDLFCEAWRAEDIGYAKGRYAMRVALERQQPVGVAHALSASLAEAAQWLSGRELPVPPGTLGGAEGLHRLADQVGDRSELGVLDMLSRFSIPIGARRRADAAACMSLIGAHGVARVLHRSARELGGLQYPARIHDTHAVSAGLRRLADMHHELVAAVTRHPRTT